MRTTHGVDDALQAAKETAADRVTTVGRIASKLPRKALDPATTADIRNGVPLMPRRPKGSPRLTMKTVNRLRDEP